MWMSVIFAFYNKHAFVFAIMHETSYHLIYDLFSIFYTLKVKLKLIGAVRQNQRR